MEMAASVFYFGLFLIIPWTSAVSYKEPGKDIEHYMNLCVKGRYQKSSPGPESELAFQCSPWKSRSCCTSETVEKMHTTRRWLNFDWNHCKQLSPRCREAFIQDLCFYECSPNVGPWIKEDKRKIRDERFVDVPLCQTDCTNWWEACKDDMTCVVRWDAHFNWTTGINTCPKGSSCKPFHQIFSDNNHFCEKVFGSFKVVPDAPGECFHLWFNSDLPNPNEVVARKKASAILGVPYVVKKVPGGSGSSSPIHGVQSFVYSIPLTLIFNFRW